MTRSQRAPSARRPSITADLPPERASLPSPRQGTVASVPASTSSPSPRAARALPAAATATLPLLEVARDLASRTRALRFTAPVTHVYRPLDYAWPLAEAYLRRVGGARGRVLLVGMNPGPWGMMQTGVPFGDPELVRTFLGLTGEVTPPRATHARVPVRGLASTRREGSGKRLWGWVEDRFGSADAFLAGAVVWNYCPLGFLDDGGANVTPEKLAAPERERLTTICDAGLARLIDVLAPRVLVGIGAYAEARLRAVAGDHADIRRLLHPSPASPLANKGWDAAADAFAADVGLRG
jgi:single-strand selective monofunctional uracil DNA glycosylase